MLVVFRQGTYTKFIEQNFIPENGCVCFVKKRNPRRNFFVIGCRIMLGYSRHRWHRDL